MANPTPLNPDARREAFEAVQAIDGPASIGSMEVVDVAVSAYLAVAQPEVNSAEELNALPVQSVFEDADGCIFEVVHNGERNSDGTFYREYLMTGDIHPYDIDEIDLPATVLKRAPETPRR